MKTGVLAKHLEVRLKGGDTQRLEERPADTGTHIESTAPHQHLPSMCVQKHLLINSAEFTKHPGDDSVGNKVPALMELMF